MLHLGSFRTALAATALGFALAAPSAYATWTDPEVVSPTGQSSQEPNVAADASGNALLVWSRSDGTNFRVQARRRLPDGTLGPVQAPLSGSGHNAFFVDVAMNASGDAYIVWHRSDGTNVRIEGRARSAAGVLGPVQTLSSSGQDATRPDVGVAANGDAVVVWQRSDGANTRIQARTRFANGTLSATQNMSSSGHPASDARVAVDPAGDAVAVWEQFDGSAQRIQVGARSAAGVVSAAQYVSAAGQQGSNPRVAIDSSGNSAFIWEQFPSGQPIRVQTRSRTSAGVISPTQTLSNTAINAFQPDVATNPGGDAVFVWTDGRVEMRTRPAGGALSSSVAISGGGSAGINPSVGIDTTGNAVAVWRRSDSSNIWVEARRRSSTGSFSPVQVISPAGLDAFDAFVAVGGNGAATAIWQQDENNTFTDIQASGGP